MVKQALEAAREVVYRRRHAQRQRDGMLETLADGFEDAPTVEQLAESVLHHGIDLGAPGERYQVALLHRDRGCRRRESGKTTKPHRRG